jgi:branched-chain amino acid transport system substrate-binding protein
MSRRLTLLGALTTLATLAAAALASTAVASPSAASQQGVSCAGTLKLGIVTPLTGGAGFLGQEQLTWARYAVKTLPANYKLKIRLVLGDTPVEQGAQIAGTVAQRMIADRSVVAIIGPATSGAVAATSEAYDEAGMAHIGSSATRTSLTKGAQLEATKSFFRVIPGDYIQGPSDARFMIDKLDADNVVLIDFQEPYSQGLVEAAEVVLKANNVTTTRISIPNTVTDFSSFVTRVPTSADVVLFPTQKPADAQTFSQQMIEQGRRAIVFGTDGANDPSNFKTPGAYVSNFAPDISAFAYNKQIIDGWKADNPDETLGSFGPPTYLAVQVALNAIRKACDKGNGRILDRRDVIRNVKKIRVQNSILGGTFRFSTKSNDPLNTSFYIFQIQPNGTYKLVTE